MADLEVSVQFCAIQPNPVGGISTFTNECSARGAESKLSGTPSMYWSDTSEKKKQFTRTARNLQWIYACVFPLFGDFLSVVLGIVPIGGAKS